MSKTFYEAKSTLRGGTWYGRLYKYDGSGNQEITIHRTEGFDTEGEATDAIIEWAEDNGYEPELG